MRTRTYRCLVIPKKHRPFPSTVYRLAYALTCVYICTHCCVHRTHDCRIFRAYIPTAVVYAKVTKLTTKRNHYNWLLLASLVSVSVSRSPSPSSLCVCACVCTSCDIEMQQIDIRVFLLKRNKKTAVSPTTNAHTRRTAKGITL